MSVPTVDQIRDLLIRDVNASGRLDTQCLDWYPAPEHLADPDVFAAGALLTKIASKCADIREPNADQAALSLFLEMNEHCRGFIDWVDPSPVFETVLGEVKNLLYQFFTIGEYPYELLCESHILSSISTGKGAVVGGSGTTFLEKVGTMPFTTTNEFLYHSYVTGMGEHPLWRSAITQNPHRGPSIVEGSVAFTVPKNRVIDRVACKEPNGNMCYQKGIQALVEMRLKSFFGIDLKRQQDYNRALARKGSIDGSYATLDLRSASDTISMGLVERLLPRNTLNWLKIARSPTVFIPEPWEKRYPLYMLSSMGNAYTFPVQTAIFAAVVLSVYKLMGIRPIAPFLSYPGNYGVNGDDIIVVPEAYDEVARTLTSFGFMVNLSKSFAEGPFRESCGGDYLNGRDVRPIYIRSLKTPQDRYSLINLLSLWGCRHGFDLRRTMSALFRSVRKIYVPRYEGLDAGIQIVNPKLVWNREPSHYRAYKVRKNEVRVTVPSETVFHFNEEAVLLAALGGTLPNGLWRPRVHTNDYELEVQSNVGWRYLGVPLHSFCNVSIPALEAWESHNYPLCK